MSVNETTLRELKFSRKKRPFIVDFILEIEVFHTLNLSPGKK